MKILYLPVYRMATNYVVNFGRRWSIVEQLLLRELFVSRRSVGELAASASLPTRLVIEALINLLRAGWIEVRSGHDGTKFDTTEIGKLRAKDDVLPVQLQTTTKWMSLCVDRLTGSWLRADDLDLVYERDLPENAVLLEPIVQTYNPTDGKLRDLLFLHSDESLESTEPRFRTPSRPFAKIWVEFDDIFGLPSYASLALKLSLLEKAKKLPDLEGSVSFVRDEEEEEKGKLCDDLLADDIIVGGENHWNFVEEILSKAATTVIVHSCFVQAEAMERLLPLLESAAKRGVRIELLWGLAADPEEGGTPKPITEAEKVLNRLGPTLRSKVQLSPNSSGSHSKAIIYDDRNGDWTTVLGSCNFLSSRYEDLEISVKSRSGRLASQLLGNLIAAQLPSFGSWPPIARRLNRIWDRIRGPAKGKQEVGHHKLTLLIDEDHYACVTRARDSAKQRIVMGCDLWGLAAETSVVVPMERAGEMGKTVKLYYNRPSKLLSQEGRAPDVAVLRERKIGLAQLSKLHGKFLLWDDDALAITSFNWMSTVTGTRAQGAEIGLLIQGPDVGKFFADKLAEIAGVQIASESPDQGVLSL